MSVNARSAVTIHYSFSLSAARYAQCAELLTHTTVHKLDNKEKNAKQLQIKKLIIGRYFTYIQIDGKALDDSSELTNRRNKCLRHYATGPF